MISFKSVFSIFLLMMIGCVIPTYKAKISLTPVSQSKHNVQIQNMLTVGTGPVTSQVFLENLHAEMILTFKKHGIQSDFTHIGKVDRPSALKLDSLINDRFDSYLVFNSANSGFLDMSKQKYTVVGPGVYGTGYGNQYSEKYSVTLYSTKGELKKIWEGNLTVDFDVANKSKYKQISELIFRELSKNNISFR